MTRINVGVNPEDLMDQHLVAEYREIGRISTFFENKILKNKTFDIPEKFCLGTGHMSFFLDKGKFIETRFGLLKEEMYKRGFAAKLEFRNTWKKYDREDMFKDYSPTKIDKIMIIDRINNKMPKKPRYYGKIKNF